MVGGVDVLGHDIREVVLVGQVEDVAAASAGPERPRLHLRLGEAEFVEVRQAVDVRAMSWNGRRARERRIRR